MPDSTLYLYTSLTAGSSHIVTATSRIETILKANKLPFRAVDVATDEAARKLWGRRSKGKKLPGLVKYGDIVGDLEEVEEWNEFGELRMVINSVQDLGGMPATSNPVPAATEAKVEPTPATHKPSTIKIQDPPVTKPEDKKDDLAVLALRQASSEAASKAKAKSDDKKEPVKEQATEVPAAGRAHRGSVAPELPDTAPDSPKAAKRPTLVPEQAAVSSANFHADNAEMLGLVGHHRGSRVSTLEDADQDKMVHEIRQSISAEPTGNLDALRKEAAEKTKSESIEEVPSPVGADVAIENKEELMEPNEPKGNAIAEMIATAVAPQGLMAEPKKEVTSAKDDTKAGLVPKSAE
ncbi:Glutaredoxin [Penicillium robsamsonii]|uniref:Glutaredoxin n=1 Tax=Penicillium robsamsonii TaxID=1792511 RepID=UPI00254898D1|nr:Glutaredoxin [Penicillium robsamsonii]KAJ5817416.1 Glutaredoxin [Penicillium robsamsonii]